MDDLYDELAPLYHLVYQDWGASLVRQGEQLAALIRSEWPGSQKILDVSCGIGTQAIGLARQGYSLVGSDISEKSVHRAQRESSKQNTDIPFSVCDMRKAHQHHGTGFDVVISCDNSVPHLLTDQDLLLAFEEMSACLSSGGGCIITVRDYEQEKRGKHIVKPYGARLENGKRYLIFQVWDFDGDHYDLAFYFVEEDLSMRSAKTHVMRSRYYAVSITKLQELMCHAGFKNVRRIDDAFHQPVLMGTKAS